MFYRNSNKRKVLIMNSPWIAFFVGSFLGGIIGMGVLSLCVIASQSDRNMERISGGQKL